MEQLTRIFLNVVATYAEARVRASRKHNNSVAVKVHPHRDGQRVELQIDRMSPQKRTVTQTASQPSTSSQVPVSETRNAYGREMGDGVPT
ncbi:hypothetical protein Tco_1114437 [Tanacetum coccineum]|uniref:Uncharacterized protein n=1 Tax=Tanacetum coccineum TaxID=301880 RepID=A0ABQ5IVC1_9ASTR